MKIILGVFVTYSKTMDEKIDEEIDRKLKLRIKLRFKDDYNTRRREHYEFGL